MSAWCTAVIFLVATVGLQVDGHGLLWDPPNRSSIFRAFPDLNLPANYNDNQNFCGGKAVQWEQNGGRCGPCGDNYADPTPRANENGGLYGNGAIARTYHAKTNIQVQVNITASHKGYFTFNICDLSVSDPETEECFNLHPLPQTNGALEYYIAPEMDIAIEHFIYLQLPEDIASCERCVLRWHYWTGNSDGVCDDGSNAIGCGPQEVFRSCADIVIV